MNTTHKFTVVKRVSKNGFDAIADAIIDYDPYTEDEEIDDKIRRIDQGVYKGTLIQSHKIMVFDAERNTEDIRDLIETYFGISPCSLLITKDHSGPLSTRFIRDWFAQYEEDVNEQTTEEEKK